MKVLEEFVTIILPAIVAGVAKVITGSPADEAAFETSEKLQDQLAKRKFENYRDKAP